MKKTPLSLANERFTSKEKLVEAVQKLATQDLWLDRVNEVKGLARVSNAKLIRLHEILTSVKKDFGSRAKLIDAILTLEKRGKDAGYKARLEAYPLPRLVDLHGAASRRAKRAEAKAKAAPAPKKKPAAKKAKSAAAQA
ncbi:MAG: hypothetical protein HS104_28320 [Polyangiaceae bacterium]|nr:hypothetical protein [Polyangiaceae bacterium]MCL4751544.1 hypothetical protein [Myxococcales bacterium]